MSDSPAADPEFDFEFLGSESVTPLNYNQQFIYSNSRSDLIAYLRNKAKKPKRNEGYAESNVRPIARRIHQIHEYFWNGGTVITELSTDHADQFVTALNQDTYRTRTGDPYAEGSKRKFTESLKTYFQFRDIEWQPEITFGQGEPTMDSDPFERRERPKLLDASYEYRSPPNYTNLSPEERDRWKAHLAQQLGEPKESIGPDRWEELQQSWKFPSLISTSLDLGPRAALINRLTTGALDLQNGEVYIPPEMAVKNNTDWTNELTSDSVMMLEKWLEQRSNMTKYDNSDRIWLNRKGNPYDSGNLNDLLDSLIEIADIDQGNRKLTWHSIRHSTGLYIYNQKEDLGMVADILRHKSIEAAEIYSHPTPEAKREVIEAIR
jgi:site-specific recombinase XerD